MNLGIRRPDVFPCGCTFTRGAPAPQGPQPTAGRAAWPPWHRGQLGMALLCLVKPPIHPPLSQPPVPPSGGSPRRGARRCTAGCREGAGPLSPGHAHSHTRRRHGPMRRRSREAGGATAPPPPISCRSRGGCPALPWQRRRRLRLSAAAAAAAAPGAPRPTRPGPAPGQPAR